MKIGASPPISGGAGGHRAVSAPRPDGGRDGFADILREGRGNARLGPGERAPFHPIIDADGARFTVETHIGDAAIRFDARPIVAPVGETEGAAAETFAPPPMIDTQVDAGPTVTYPALLQLVGEIAARLPVMADRMTQSQARPTRGDTSAPRVNSVGAGTWRPTVVAAPSPTLRRAPVPVEARGNAAAGPPPPPAANQNILAARVAAFPREIIVVLRGLSLTASEARSLSDAMRGLLTQHQLGDRIVRIVGAGERA